MNKINTISINSDHPDDAVLARAADVLRRSGVIVHATETVYGLAAVWNDPAALEKVSRLKGRPAGQPYSIMVPAIAAVADFTGWDHPALQALLAAVFPGAITLVLPRRRPLTPAYWNQFPEVGIRMPDHRISRQLVAQSGVALITTSANISGQPTPADAAGLDPAIAAGADLVLDSGPCPLQVPSTVVRVDVERRQYQILRPGAFPPERFAALFEALG